MMQQPPPARPPLPQQQQQQQQTISRSSASTLALRYPSNKKTIYDRNLNRSKTAELSRASFAYLFIEMIGYAQKRVKGIADLEKRLNSHGYPIGIKLLDLLIARAPASSAQRPIRILPLLQFITTTLWRHLFGRAADALERAANNPAEYMVTDNEPLVNSYVSMPREMSQLNCAAFVAGIIEGVCDASGFSTISVTAHSVREQEKASEGSSGGGGGGDAAATAAGVGMWPGKTIFLIKFKPEVLEREEILGRET